MVAGANLHDHLAVLSAAVAKLFHESAYGRRLAAWGGAADAGLAAKRAGLSQEQVSEWLAGRLPLPPYQESVLVCALLDEAAKARDWDIPRDDPRDLPDGVPLTARFRLDCPVMDAGEWKLFVDHLSGSAARFAADVRRSGGHGSVPVVAAVDALAAAVAGAGPGERVKVAVPELSKADKEQVRQVLVRSRDRAASEDAAGDRPGHVDAAGLGVDALHEAWAAWMGWRDPRTGWVPRKTRVLEG